VVINNKPVVVAPAPAPAQGTGSTAPAAPAAAATSAPWSDKEMTNIQNLVREAMGFNEKRGDSLNVVNVPFTQPDLLPADPVPAWQQPGTIALGKEVGKAVLFLVMTLIVVFGVVRPALKAISEQPTYVAPEPAESMAEGGVPALPAAPLTQLDQMRQIARSDPATVANVVKSWVGEPKS
jgi:flagellar M-ring protein FliF